jgi:hypothetical protein
MSNPFFDTIDELVGGDFSPLPVDEYEFKIAEYKFKYVEQLDASKVELTLEVVNDEDGFNGRKLWSEGWVDGTFEGRGGITSRCVFETFKLVKALGAANPQHAGWLAEFPHFNLESFKEDQSSLVIPKDEMTGEPDYRVWDQYMSTIVAEELSFRASVKHEKKQVKVEGQKDERGKQLYIDDPDGGVKAVIDKYLWK